ncbi:MAG: hypothetical protein U0792_07775 [Gemmataceae bacterium]
MILNDRREPAAAGSETECGVMGTGTFAEPTFEALLSAFDDVISSVW